MLQTDEQVWYQRIFHPSDFSDASNIAFAHALKLAVSTNGKLTILHTGSDGGSSDWLDFPRVRGTLERWEMLPPHSSKEALFSLGLDAQKITSADSDPVHAVLRYLGEHPHDLIILATHQYDGFDRWVHKAVAEPIARRSGEMTLFIPHGAEGFVSYENGAVSLHNILIPVDHSPEPQVAVDGAISLVHALDYHGTVFTLLHVGDEHHFPRFITPQRESWKWRKVTLQGEIEQKILRTADACRADLIVMATEGHHGFLDALRGSTTERIVRHAKCPVLAVPTLRSTVASQQESVLWRPAI